MHRLAWAISMALALVAFGGCSTITQPRLGTPVISQSELSPGESTVITIDARDRSGAISRIEAVVMQDTRQKLPLYDDGQEPDVEAGDGIWSMRVKVPFMAPPGPYTLQITAYDEQGEVVLINTRDGETVPLMKVCRFVIAYPKDKSDSKTDDEPA